jgi:hypothetical protein
MGRNQLGTGLEYRAEKVNPHSLDYHKNKKNYYYYIFKICFKN